MMSYIRWVCCVIVLVWLPTSWAQFSPYQPIPKLPPIPADNPMSAEKTELGKTLFFDWRLSQNQNLSCQSCHDLTAGGENGQALAKGSTGKQGRRSVLTVWNAGHNTIFNRDGSAKTLEAQILAHWTTDTVMSLAQPSVLEQRLRDLGYLDLFKGSFSGKSPLSAQNAAKAVAAFIRTLNTVNSPFDRFIRGEGKISVQAQKGFQLFENVGCASCHFWENFAGPVPNLAFKMGEGFYELFPNYPDSAEEKKYRLGDDLGRYEFTKQDYEKRMWRVTGLRNVALTAPYFHNGSVNTLEEAIRVMAVVQLDRKLSKKQIEDIRAFLMTLTGEFPVIELPRLPQKAGTPRTLP